MQVARFGGDQSEWVWTLALLRFNRRLFRFITQGGNGGGALWDNAACRHFCAY